MQRYTIKKLKEAIKDLPEDMPVGGSGHYGEYLETFSAEALPVRDNLSNKNSFIAFILSIEDAGPEPD